MHKIKQLPEDFIVKEINDIKLNDKGQYAYFLLKKRNYNTLRAIETIASKLKINKKNIDFAGNKDKNAVTEQTISIKNFDKKIKNFELKDIELKFLGKGNEKIYLGYLRGNEFVITIRNLNNKEIDSIKNKIKNNKVLIPNYFGPQRFSKNNNLIGKAIINNNFENAINLILKSNTDFNEEIKNHLKDKKNDFVVALKIIPLKLLKLYIHAYQSFIFNKTLEQYIKNSSHKNKNISDKNNKLINDNYKKLNDDINITEKIPIVGFGTELNNDDKIVKKILEKEKITNRDFIVRQIPELSSEGDERYSFVKVKDFKIIKQEKDELNKNKEKVIVSFSLPKGSYATVFIEYLFKN